MLNYVKKYKPSCIKIFGFGLVIYATTLVTTPLQADTCQDWFNSLKILKTDDCLTKCEVAPVGMDSFMCHDRCEEFCRALKPKTIPEKILGELLLYPGLTQEEQKLIKEYPIEAVKVFIQKERAEIATSRRFNRDEADDESDAFRHFIWVGLMAKEIGPALAKKFSDAHESDDPSSASSKMDLSNNAKAIEAAQELLKQDKLSQQELERQAIKALKDGKLIVIKPKGLPQ